MKEDSRKKAAYTSTLKVARESEYGGEPTPQKIQLQDAITGPVHS